MKTNIFTILLSGIIMICGIENRKRCQSQEKLLDNIWGSDSFVEPRTVDVHIRRLRSNIEIDETVKFIDTVRGAGYRFTNED